MKLQAVKAYTVPLANPGLNSHVPVARNTKLGKKLTVQGELEPFRLKKNVRWLLGAQDADRALALNPMQSWHLDLAKGKSLGRQHVHSDMHGALLDDNSYLLRDGGKLYLHTVRRKSLLSKLFFHDGDEPDEREDGVTVFVPGMGDTGQVQALVPGKSEFLIVAQVMGNPDHSAFSEYVVLRKPYTMTHQDVVWMHQFKGRVSRSPALSDGSLVVHEAEQLLIFDSQGKQTATVAMELAPNLLSVDTQDRIWGFAQDGGTLQLVGLDRQGTVLAKVAVASGTPLQPPVALADGALVVVGSKALLAVKGGQVWWEIPSPGAGAQATSDLDGLVVTTVNTVRYLDGAGREQWQLTLPEKKTLTSNPLITSKGGICFVAGLTLYCVN